MIEKHRKRIFWMIQILLSGIAITIVVVYAIFNYANITKNISRKLNEYDIIEEDHGPMNHENNKMQPKVNKEDAYRFIIKNNSIVDNSNNANEELQRIALKAARKTNNAGMIGNYMYKTKKEENNRYSVILVENTEIANYIIKIYVISGIIIILSIITISFVARKISIITIKPLEDFFEKQKQFISDASHELKTPISIIKINAQMEEKKLGTNKWNKYIQNESENMDKLVNDLLLLSKVENMENIQKYEKIDISKETEIVISSFETIAYDKGINLKNIIQKNINFLGSKEDIKHILSTLLDNAIKHTNKNDDVTIELNKEKNEIVLQVKNIGEPIPKEERERIFERFYRVDKARNRAEKRYGLGLPIAKSIVEKYKGTIEVKCDNGITNFIVKIPMD